MIRAHLCNLCSMLSHKKVYARFDLTYSRNLPECLCTKELRHGRSQRGTSCQPPVFHYLQDKENKGFCALIRNAPKTGGWREV